MKTYLLLATVFTIFAQPAFAMESSSYSSSEEDSDSGEIKAKLRAEREANETREELKSLKQKLENIQNKTGDYKPSDLVESYNANIIF